ncbi:hypothetical protein ACOYR4_13000 [Acidovorax sp. M14]|uniref:hypothetical protein n=1 Tax=Acidovorax sp. M14 TaxID=3411354 RepID=UPI003BF59F3F
MSYMQEANAIADRLRGKAPARRKKAAAASELQLQVLDFMRTFLSENDQLPPVHSVAKRFDLAISSADWHIRALLRLGFLERNAVGKLRFARGGRTA